VPEKRSVKFKPGNMMRKALEEAGAVELEFTPVAEEQADKTEQG
jgi:hypothetical protein